jgi:uncharacterized protein (DUF885 family)
MSKIVIELEISGDAREFIKGLLEDYYYTAKGNKDLLAQYETLTYTISNEWRIAK